MDVDPRCPDCGVTMEEMKLRTDDGFKTKLVSDEARGGLLGSLGMKEKYDVEAWVCPECSLTRLYADVDES
ncbi:hypothetical protein [Halomarina litorea]|uniref:hypothetical protein n=1 Tax=Halomarina litorea TaxID=2961595 RepID=UPI0020C3D968|nr:hypothetical protein [Halomarina sp. BCD28]